MPWEIFVVPILALFGWTETAFAFQGHRHGAHASCTHFALPQCVSRTRGPHRQRKTLTLISTARSADNPFLRQAAMQVIPFAAGVNSFVYTKINRDLMYDHLSRCRFRIWRVLHEPGLTVCNESAFCIGCSIAYAYESFAHLSVAQSARQLLAAPISFSTYTKNGKHTLHP